MLKKKNKEEKPVVADLPKLYPSKSKSVAAALLCDKKETVSW